MTRTEAALPKQSNSDVRAVMCLGDCHERCAEFSVAVFYFEDPWLCVLPWWGGLHGILSLKLRLLKGEVES